MNKSVAVIPAEYADWLADIKTRVTAARQRAALAANAELIRLYWQIGRDILERQARQGWALSGAPHGLKYAWDPDPDGSYTILNRFAADVLRQRPWPTRLKWLRAAGVTAVIAGDVPPDQWPCASCTFHNSDLLSECEMCNAPRPAVLDEPPPSDAELVAGAAPQ